MTHVAGDNLSVYVVKIKELLARHTYSLMLRALYNEAKTTINSSFPFYALFRQLSEPNMAYVPGDKLTRQ